jgi:transcriptional regulator with XRE-family HTH domain/Zn-dependent peptidase ImmA (M78 family)
MKLSENNIKLIFGLKLKQLRQEKGLSLSELAQKSSLSISYLNEIENGKKNPKADKIAALAEALEVSYDRLVSVKLTKHLAPISELLESNLLEQLPLDHYGIDVHKVLLQISEAPLQLSALVSTLIEMAKSLELSENNFSKTAIKTYKELNENYFPELEEAVNKFRKKVKFESRPPIKFKDMREIITDEFSYEVINETLPDASGFKTIRGINISNGKNKKLLINKNLTDSQKAFIIGKEIAYNFLNIADRPNIYSNLRLDSFDQLLNNLKASYFATALMINKQLLIDDLSKLFGKKKFDDKYLLTLPDKYNASPEMLFQRITNILSKHFNINNFYFLRINSTNNSGSYSVIKEIRLNTKDNPGGYQTNEHYCRRWLSINIIKKLESLQHKNRGFKSSIADIQKSKFLNSGNEYLSISIAKNSTLLANSNYSVTLGFLMNDEFKQKVAFANDQGIAQLIVNDTCERCQIMDCKERVKKPIVYESKIRLEKLHQELKEIIEKESN